MTEKRCSRCKEVKSLDLFNRSKRRADGHDTWCKACRKEYDKNRKEYPVSVTEKLCRKCGEVRPADDFQVNKKVKDGLHSYCYECVLDYGEQWRKENPDYQSNHYLERIENDYELKRRRLNKRIISFIKKNCREYARYYGRQRWANNPAVREYQREYQREHNAVKRKTSPEWRKRQTEYQRRWRNKPETKLKRRIVDQERLAWENETNDGSVTPESLQKIRDDQNNLCYFPHCRKEMNDIVNHPGQATIDHIKSRNKGGRNIISNIVWACRSCNSSKSDKDMDEWLESKINQENIENGSR